MYLCAILSENEDYRKRRADFLETLSIPEKALMDCSLKGSFLRHVSIKLRTPHSAVH